METPEETTPHMNAHIGANQVIGLNSSITAPGVGVVDGAGMVSERDMIVRLD
jgi:hypothetical protein